MKTLTKQLVERIELRGYNTDVNISRTSFGASDYIYVNILEEGETFINRNNAIKIRISDHSVTNIDRIFNEYHIFDESKFEDVVDGVIDHLNFYFKRDEFFIEKECMVETKAYNVQVNKISQQLWDTDVITREFVTKKGSQMLEVTRTYNNPAICYINKVTNKIYKTILK